MNKMDPALPTLIRTVLYTVFAEFPAEWASILRVLLVQIENTNNPDRHSSNTQTEARDPYTQEQGNIQPCGDLALVLWCSSCYYPPVPFHIPISSLSSSPDSLLVPHHCTALLLWSVSLLGKLHSMHFVLWPPCLFNLHRSSRHKLLYVPCVCQTNTSNGLAGAGVPLLARNHLQD